LTQNFKMSWKLVHMKDIPCPHLLLKFQPKIYKSLVTCTCPKFLCCQKMHAGPLGVICNSFWVDFQLFETLPGFFNSMIFFWHTLVSWDFQTKILFLWHTSVAWDFQINLFWGTQWLLEVWNPSMEMWLRCSLLFLLLMPYWLQHIDRVAKQNDNWCWFCAEGLTCCTGHMAGVSY